MKRIVVLVSVLILGLGSLGFSADQMSQLADKVIVDKTTRNRTLNDYVLLTRDVIQNVWTTPVNIVTSDAIKGKVAVMYEIARDGALVSVELVRGSGNTEMDRSLLRAIRSASPFPAFPDGLAAKRVLIKANFIVADLPTLPVLRVEHRTDAQGTSQSAQVESHKKYIWGVPAGTALRKDISIPDLETVNDNPQPVAKPPHSNKFKWGVDANN
ncbi:MAG: energy transducer TonB [Deltaproteobacteria bacterium]|nr:energy transducer TonB [Deltaproteobacteria bacterium]